MSEEYDAGPVHLGPLADERHRPVSTRRKKKVGTQIRVDATRVSGPIRLVLEPLLWVAFVLGLMWIVIAFEVARADDSLGGMILHRYAGPLAMVVGVFLLVATVSALLWLPGSTTAARSRTAMAGLGMLASGWLFGNLHPVHPDDFQFHTWFSVAVGILLVAICAVPWPTRPAHEPGAMTGLRWLVVLVLVAAAVVVGVVAWGSSDVALVGTDAQLDSAWREVLPYLAVIALLMAAVRFVARRPAREDGDLFVEAPHH